MYIRAAQNLRRVAVLGDETLRPLKMARPLSLMAELVSFALDRPSIHKPLWSDDLHTDKPELSSRVFVDAYDDEL